MELTSVGSTFGADEQVAKLVEQDGGAVKVVLQPRLLQDRKYAWWRGVHWSVACKSAAEARELRYVLDLCFSQLHRHGVSKVKDSLKKLR